jgi:hypothetical protein
MRPSAERTEVGQETRNRRPAFQAHPAAARSLVLALAVALPLALSACSSVPDDANPRVWWHYLSGAYLDERQPPPGLDEPYPNLGTVPPRPARPDPATRAAISAGLATERARAAEPVVPGRGASDAAAAIPTPRDPEAGTLPAGPPPRPALAVAPRVPWNAPGIDLPAPGGRTTAPAAAPRTAPEAAPPAAPPPDLLAPSGPPAAPPPDLFAPSGPPAAPPSDLLAPPPRRD